MQIIKIIKADITKIKTMMGWEPQVKLEDWLKGV